MKMLFNFNFLAYLFSFEYLKYFYNFFYYLFYSIFFTKSSFLFGFNVGWNNNFLIIFNMIKTVIVFIWEQLTILIYPLKFLSSLYRFLIDILKVFVDVFDSIIGYIKSSIKSLTGHTLMDPNESMWEKLKEIAKIIFSVTVGGSVIYFLKEINNFLLNSFIKIGDLLLKIFLRIIDIILIVLKIWYLLLKNVIIMLRFVLFFWYFFVYFHVEKNI
ncbi:hypothetical protein [Candidatus Phytoplasma solani]